jgi:hypothetical protein
MKKIFTLGLAVCSLCLLHAQATYTVLPSQCNPNIAQNNDSNYILIDTTMPRLHRLFLFLPGTGATPRNSRYILRTAAAMGYDAIGLDYVNNETVADLCAGQNTYCNGDARAEIFYGQDYSNAVTVDSADGIRTRLLDVLKYLDATFPAYGWSEYLVSPDSISWPAICVSGHSQGAGMASIMAYWFRVGRGVFFATGGDWYGTTTTAWMSGPDATPASLKFAFTHRQDELFWGSKGYAPGIWDTLGLYQFGYYISVDTLSGDYYGVHAFTSNMVIPSTDTLVYHNCVVTDGFTPLDGAGVPVFQPLWQYMLGGAGYAAGVGAIATQPSVSVYPNPASDHLLIQYPGYNAGAAITISDALGQVVYQAPLTGAATSIDIHAWQGGIYLAAIYAGASRSVVKVVKW